MHFEFSSIKEGLGPLSSTYLKQLQLEFDASVFVETGTYLGDTAFSLSSVFNKVISIELSEELYAKACERFRNVANITLLKGDSPEQLRRALQLSGTERTIVWLDAHYSGEGTAKAQSNTPVVNEIDVLSRHGNGLEIILIDDIRLFTEVKPGFLTHESINGYPDLKAIIELLRATPHQYECFVIGDILVALPKSVQGSYSVSEIVKATTALRLNSDDSERTRKLENTVANAKGKERDAILAYPDLFKEQLQYGLGGHYCYWRGLVYEAEGRIIDAKKDFELAIRCGVSVPPRVYN